MGTPSAHPILIVDDDALVRRAVCRTLRDLGVPIREAPDGPAALEQVSREPPALILTDYAMPGMNGRVLAERVKAIEPAVKVLVHSGNAVHHLVGAWWPDFDVTLVPKPALPEVLRAVVRAALHEDAPAD